MESTGSCQILSRARVTGTHPEAGGNPGSVPQHSLQQQWRGRGGEGGRNEGRREGGRLIHKKQIAGSYSIKKEEFVLTCSCKGSV